MNAIHQQIRYNVKDATLIVLKMLQKRCDSSCAYEQINVSTVDYVVLQTKESKHV